MTWAKGGQHGDIGAGLQGEVVRRLDARALHQIDAARIDDDQLGALAQPLLQPRAEDRMTVGRVGADDDDDVGLLHRVEVLRAGGGAEGDLQPVAGRRMADAGAGVDVVVAEAGADQLLDEEGLLVGAARRSDAADGALARLRLDAAELRCRPADRLVPGHLTPRVGDCLADHRLQDALAMGGIAPGEATLDAGMAAIGLAVLPRHHAHDFLAAHLRLEGATDAAIGAGGHDRMFRLADRDQALLRQRCRRAGLDAGAAGDALAVEEGLAHARRHPAVEAASGDGQREGALNLGTGP